MRHAFITIAALTVLPIGLAAQEPTRAVAPEDAVLASWARSVATHRLGVAIDMEAKAAGAVLDSVIPGGPAASAGLRRGDLITRIHEKPVGGAPELVRLAASLQPGTKVTLEFRRDGTILLTSLTIGEGTGEPVVIPRSESHASAESRPAAR